MNTKLPTCVSMAVLCALLAAPARAQTGNEPQRKVEFVSAEPRTLDSERARHSAQLCKAVATFQTRPVLAIVREHHITRGAFAAVFGPKAPEQPYGPRPLTPGRAWVDRQTVYADDEARAADRWTIAAIDEPTAKAVTQAILRSYAEEVHKTLEKERTKHEKEMAQCQRLRRSIDEYETQIGANQEACRQSGVDKLDNQMIDSAVARFEQERRLNKIDIAGLNARLAAAQQRLETVIREGDANTRHALERIQVELEIELIGKLARRDALAREMQELEKGREARSKIDELRSTLATARHELTLHEKTLSRLQESVRQLERLVDFAVTDNRVVISPIAPTRR